MFTRASRARKTTRPHRVSRCCGCWPVNGKVCDTNLAHAKRAMWGRCGFVAARPRAPRWRPKLPAAEFGTRKLRFGGCWSLAHCCKLHSRTCCGCVCLRFGACVQLRRFCARRWPKMLAPYTHTFVEAVPEAARRQTHANANTTTTHKHQTLAYFFRS